MIGKTEVVVTESAALRLQGLDNCHVGDAAAFTHGSRLWQFSAQTGIAAAPISYSVDDQQHVAVAAGWGTFFALAGGEMTASLGMKNTSRILAFRKGGDASLPAADPTPRPLVPEPVAEPASEEIVAAGKTIYYERCWHCHGDGAASGGITPDLRYSNADTHAAWAEIVLGGTKQANGMPPFGHILAQEDSEAVRNYVLERARRAWERQQAQSSAGE